ncbi:hypothetical protein BDV96DRAFT_643697 [Lophiotrema nucula]|uniref:NACHT domain-containing protein n=1 Tax=Lophiotrema nucula TaxID=690887 RepID=A0A6A5ZG37_9PLEO|nr:hypothetical protein BDV96DRAFT_643697 [Lophiotrema nucula]
MEPLSAFGVAAGVLQFVDFTGRLLTESYEILSSNTGSTSRNEELLKITQDLLALNKRLQTSAKDREAPGRQTTLASRNEATTDDIIGAQFHSLVVSCNHVGQDLIAVLDKLRLEPENKRRKWRSFRQALLSVWSQSDIEALQRRIDNFRQQISLSLLVSMREALALKESETDDTNANATIENDDLDKGDLNQQTGPTKAKKANERPFVGRKLLNNLESKEAWQSTIIDLIHQSYIDNDSAFRPHHPRGSFGAKDKPLAEALLESLGFSRMKSRVGRIVKQHCDTFEWLFAEQGRAQAKWTHFPSWLRSEQSVYWITGKPGAGKSTLMKFISSDRRTKECLREWAKDSKITLASFFFWSSGDKMQKSQEGLLRTLLHETLAQRPELVPVVLPHRWESYSLFGIDKQTWSWSELVTAFSRLISATTADKLVFVVDGLDEFDGDHTEIIEFISGLSSVPHIKLCVASRPWPVFEDAFNSRPSLMLQYLTYHDIRKYVSKKFILNPGFANLERLDGGFAKDLIENIVEKASGVFLWVVLVVRSLLEGLTIGDRLSDLQRRLDAIPAELENLFWNMMTSLKEVDFERACELFQLVVAHGCPTLLELGYADDEEEMTYRRAVKYASKVEKDARSAIMRRRLNHLSRGLLEVHVPPNTSLSNAEVVYLHRTVKDFLDQEEVWAKVLAATGNSFNVQGSWCRSSISVLKTMLTTHLGISQFWTQVTHCVEMAVEMKKECHGTHKDCDNCRIQHIKLLDEIDRVANVLASTRNRQGRSLKDAFAPGSSPHWTMTRYDLYSCPTFLNFAVSCQLYEYVEAKLKERGSRVLGLDIPLLHTAVCSYRVFQELGDSTISHDTPSLRLIKLLFEHDADPEATVFNETIWERTLGYVLGGCPQIPVSVAPIDLLERIHPIESAEPLVPRPDTPDPDSEDFKDPKDPVRINRLYLQGIMEVPVSRNISSACSSFNSVRENESMHRFKSAESLSIVESDLWIDILKMFLVYGADPEVCKSALSGHIGFNELVQLCELGPEDLIREINSGKTWSPMKMDLGEDIQTPRAIATSRHPSKPTEWSRARLASHQTGGSRVGEHAIERSRAEDDTQRPLVGAQESSRQRPGKAKIWKRLGAVFAKRRNANT